MRKVYKPIADQAQATKDNMVADHRAWIGPLTQAIEMPAIDKPISYIMQYANSGRQPALLITSGGPKTYTLEQWNLRNPLIS